MSLKNRLLQNKKVVVGAVVVVVAVVLILVFTTGVRRDDLAPSFWEAHIKAARVSQEIRDLTRETTENIKNIEISKIREEREEVNLFIAKARKNNAEAYSRAFELSSNLRVMTEALRESDSRRAQQIAYEAVATELSLVSEFINYTQHMTSFLDGLEQSLTSDAFQDKLATQQVLREINRKVASINDLNSRFLDIMKNLD